MNDVLRPNLGIANLFADYLAKEMRYLDKLKAIRNARHVPDQNFLTLIKAIKECPKTWQELEKKSVKVQAARNRLN